MISLGAPHVRPMGHTCGEPNEIELTPIGVELNGSRRVPLSNDLEPAPSTHATSTAYLERSGTIIHEHANGRFDFVWLPARVEGPHVGPQHVR